MFGAPQILPAISSHHTARFITRRSLNDWRVSAYSLVVGSILLIVFSSLLKADDLTGLSDNDPKDLMPAPRQSAPKCLSSSDLLFQPLPTWTHNVTMTTMPYQLTPFGRKPISLTNARPTPNSLTPPKDGASTATTAPVTPKPTPAAENPALVAVSPFLQWVRANPQAAAAQARQQANGYQPAPNGAPAAPGAAAPTGAPVVEDPYWLPPLIDSSTFTTGSGGSSATYSTPQR
jgi:hypothetical protein